MIATNESPVALESMSEPVIAALRVARDSCKRGMLRDSYAKNVAGDALSSTKVKPVEQIMAMARDFFDRGASEADLLCISQAFSDEFSSWYRAREKAPDWKDARIDEETAEGEEDRDEVIFDRDRSYPAFQRLRRATMNRIAKSQAQLRAGR